VKQLEANARAEPFDQKDPDFDAAASVQTMTCPHPDPSSVA